MTNPYDELIFIERTDGGRPIEAFVEDREDGTRILRHVIDSGTLETFIAPGGELTVFLDGRLLLDVGPPMLLQDKPEA